MIWHPLAHRKDMCKGIRSVDKRNTEQEYSLCFYTGTLLWKRLLIKKYAVNVENLAKFCSVASIAMNQENAYTQ
ncbi:hypothetical protein AOY83_13430 [Escherichia coli]|nr:hypothetical protein AOY83_13430 [Escherichia coli]